MHLNFIRSANVSCVIIVFSDYVLPRAFASFRRYCFETSKLPADLYMKLCQILNEDAQVEELFPFFVKFTYEMFPHLSCMSDLRHFADFNEPAMWYADTRRHKRRIIFHGGPTNSGKTYQAMQRFLNAETGIYCGPLKLLAMEVFKKSNDNVCYGFDCVQLRGQILELY